MKRLQELKRNLQVLRGYEEALQDVENIVYEEKIETYNLKVGCNTYQGANLNLITDLNIEILDVETHERFGFTVARVELPFNSELPGWQFLELSKALLLEYKLDLIEGLQEMNFGYIDSEDTVE